MSDTYNPDWRYANLTQTEIEDRVKARSSQLLSQQHVIPESSGKKIKFRVTEKDIEHLVADALHRAKGKLFISDISTLPQHFNAAKYIESTKDTKSLFKFQFDNLLSMILEKAICIMASEDSEWNS